MHHYDPLQEEINKLPRQSEVMLLVDFNAIVAKEHVRELARDSWNQ